MELKIISVAEVINNPIFADMCTEYACESGNADIGFSQPNKRFYQTMESLGRCFCVGVFDGENSNSLKGFRIISEKIELNVAAVQSNNVGWASGWVPIEKGKQIRFFVNASESFTARLIPNIQSSL